MRMILLMLCIVFLTGCTQHRANNIYVLPEKEILSDEIMLKVAIKLKKEKGLHPCGTGGQMLHQIKMLALSFDYYHEISIEEGRELLVDAVNEFAAQVNASQTIRPYLDDSPFGPQNIEIRIFLHNSDGSDLALGKLRVISSINKLLEYDIRHLETERLETIYQESFEEAVSKINLSKADSMLCGEGKALI